VETVQIYIKIFERLHTTPHQGQKSTARRDHTRQACGAGTGLNAFTRDDDVESPSVPELATRFYRKICASTRNRKSPRRRLLTRPWWTFAVGPHE
jgi:hypothetical protein